MTPLSPTPPPAHMDAHVATTLVNNITDTLMAFIADTKEWKGHLAVSVGTPTPLDKKPNVGYPLATNVAHSYVPVRVYWDGEYMGTTSQTVVQQDGTWFCDILDLPIAVEQVVQRKQAKGGLPIEVFNDRMDTAKTIFDLFIKYKQCLDSHQYTMDGLATGMSEAQAKELYTTYCLDCDAYWEKR